MQVFSEIFRTILVFLTFVFFICRCKKAPAQSLRRGLEKSKKNLNLNLKTTMKT